MFRWNRWQAGTAWMLVGGLTVGTTLPLVSSATVQAQTLQISQAAQANFSDVPAGFWAQGFIQALAARNIVAGFPDGSFRPNEPVTRAQFAAMIRNAFNQAPVRSAVNFVDVPANFWARNAIQQAYQQGFVAGYPGNVFNPSQNIPRVQALVSLSNGLRYSPSVAAETILQQTYTDAAAIPDYARPSIAAATERRLVVNYPSVQNLNPNQVATRADVAAFLYQALASNGTLTAIASPYIVGGQTAQTPPPVRQVRIPAGTVLPVRYTEAERILVTPTETAPLTLTIPQNITTAQGELLIPAGSQVVGELRPAQGGSQFVARELVLPNNQRRSISATSEVITRTQEIRKGSNTGNILRNAALGAAAAAGISAVTGDRAIATEEVLGGAGIGALLGLFLGQDRVTVISIDPNTDLTLRLNTDLALG